MTWAEKEKQNPYFCVMCNSLTDNAVDHLTIRHSGRSDMSARNEDKNPSPVENQFYDFKDKQPKLKG